jgi:hypothetical protein
LALVFVLVLLVGKDAGFCDIIVGLSALSLLILLVGAAAVLFLLSDSDGGLCKGAGEEEDEFLRSADGC